MSIYEEYLWLKMRFSDSWGTSGLIFSKTW